MTPYDDPKRDIALELLVEPENGDSWGWNGPLVTLFLALSCWGVMFLAIVVAAHSGSAAGGLIALGLGFLTIAAIAAGYVRKVW